MLSREYTSNTNYTDTEMYNDDLENTGVENEGFTMRDLETEIMNSPRTKKM